MTQVLSSHPDPARLKAFRVGAISPEELAEVEAHLADCPSCLGSLKSLSDDSLVDLVHRSYSATTPQPDGTPASLSTQGPITEHFKPTQVASLSPLSISESPTSWAGRRSRPPRAFPPYPLN